MRPNSESANRTDAAPTMPSFRDAADRWRAQLTNEIQKGVGQNPVTRLVLSQAHPGGLAQLYAEQPTLLANLVRDPANLKITKAAALDVMRQADRMLADHGSVVVHLAIGTASWEDFSSSESGTTPLRRTTPILLRPIDLTIDDEGEVTLELRPGIEISNRLLAELQRFGIQLEPSDILNLVRARHGFSPAPALKMISEASAQIPGLELRDSLTIGIFSHPTAALLRELGAPQWLSLSPVVRAVAGDKHAKADLTRPLPEPNPRDRDPWEERGLGLQSPELADVVEAATGDDSVYISVPASANLPHLVASVAAEHAARDKKVLVVTGRAGLQEPIMATFETEGALGVAEVVSALPGSAAQVQRDLQAAMVDASSTVNSDAIDSTRTKLRRSRASLASYTEALHETFPQWGVSAFDALQVLTDLTSIPGGPKTKVRLSAHSLVALADDQGGTAQDLLERADRIGVFDGDEQRNLWTGVQLVDPEQVRVVLDLLGALDQRILPATRTDMERVAKETRLQQTNTPVEWARQLEVLRGVRDSLDVFEPSVFERSAADLVIATATKEWRKEHGISMGRSQRRGLLRQARDQVLPGRHVDDLHAQLIQVQERRDEWRKVSEPDAWPTLPRDMKGILEVNQELQDVLGKLQPFLSPIYDNLPNKTIDELQHLVRTLVMDPQGAAELPEKVGILGQLDSLGLSNLVADLQARKVRGKMLGPEMELAWWASVLGLMLASDQRLGGFDPSSLQDALTEVRLLEEAQVHSLGPQISARVAKRRQSALAAHAAKFAETETALAARTSAPAYYSRIPLSWDLIPVVLTFPSLVPQVVPWGRHIDVVILVGVEDLPLAELIPVIARGNQVVVVASAEAAAREDKSSSDRAATALAQVLPRMELRGTPQRLNDTIVRLLAKYGVEAAGISVPGRRSAGRVDLVSVDGRGMPAPGVHAIESSAAEVDAVVDLVKRHFEEQPDTSLAVVALNRCHGDRLRVALEAAAGNTGALAEAMSGAPTANPLEPFVIVDSDSVGDLRRDRVIISSGFARTPHGRVIHDFGAFSEPGGEHALARALRCVRQDLTVVSGINPVEVHEDRLRQPGARMLVDLVRLGASGGSTQEATDGQMWPTLEAAPDHLLVDLAERLHGLGLNVVPNLGVPGGMRIPLGIGHPEVPDELLVAIMTDDQDYLSEPSMRVRDWLRPQLLEGQGWKVRTELSMAVFIDPNREAEAIVQLVLDAVDEYHEQNERFLADSSEEPAGDFLETQPGQGPGESLGEEAEAELVEELPSAPAAHAPVPSMLPNSSSPRPPIAVGLPLAAYGDDQLDDVAHWIFSEKPDLTVPESIEVMREALHLTRRGAQSDAVLRNVVVRNWPKKPELPEQANEPGERADSDGE